MNVVYKEDPREWRKTICLTAIGLGVFCTLLRWRRHLSNTAWVIALIVVALVVIVAFVRPRLFRGYYRFSQKLGFHLSQFLGRIVLAAFFILILTPLGIFRRAFGYDPLRLKRPPKDASCWKPAKKPTPLERLF
jgi:hypothetical protein